MRGCVRLCRDCRFSSLIEDGPEDDPIDVKVVLQQFQLA